MEIKDKIEFIANRYFEGNNVKFASKMDTSETNIRNYRKGSSQPKLDFIVNLNKQLEISFDWLLKNENGGEFEITAVSEPHSKYLLRTDRKTSIQKVPLYDIQAAAGLTSVFNDKPNIVDFIQVPNLPKCDGAIAITGDSMYPLLKSGDIVIYKEVKNKLDGIFWGEMYLLSYVDEGDNMTLVKYIHKSDKGEEYIKLVSQNQNHQPKDIKLRKVKALALIKASIRINSMI